MKTYTAHVYYNRVTQCLTAFCGPPSWVGPNFELIGTFEFNRTCEPDRDSIYEWGKTRLKLLEITHPVNLQVINYASHAFWG